MTNKFTIYNDDCLNVLKTMEDNSIDSCVTDPPYGLSFMGKSWDYDVPKKEIWEQVFRVLKPGGHLLAFFGSRTYHRGVLPIEDAGFEIRDQIMWLYGSGFPKSHNIGKAIDTAAGATRKIVGTKKGKGGENLNKLSREGMNDKEDAKGCGAYGIGAKQINIDIPITEPATEEARQWEGWGTALKPAHEPIVVARKPITQTVAKNVLEYGTGAINIDECRVEVSVYGDSNGAPEYNPSKGRWPANVIHDGSDEVVDEFAKFGEKKSCMSPSTAKSPGIIFGGSRTQGNLPMDSGTAARFFYCAKASKSDKDEGLDDFLTKKVVTFQTGGGASGKPSSLSAGRNTEYKNNHPTVKPTELMKYLCRLVTPKGGIVLDPFMGSGSTGKAALQEKFRFIGIEMDKEYFDIAEVRIKAVSTLTLEDFFH